jgi:hypothetical protein
MLDSDVIFAVRIGVAAVTAPSAAKEAIPVSNVMHE